jgi:hypothetical protein
MFMEIFTRSQSPENLPLRFSFWNITVGLYAENQLPNKPKHRLNEDFTQI